MGPLTVLFSPSPPTHRSVAEKVCRHLGYQVVSGSADLPADVGFYWDIKTWRSPAAALVTRAEAMPVLNLRCSDFSKRRVDEVFAQVSGRSLGLDPRTTSGRFVAKSDANAAHDGVVVNGPLPAASPTQAYQSLINNQVDANTVVDLRTPIYGGAVTVVYRLYRPLANRFAIDDSAAELAEPADVFTPTELTMLSRFAEAFGMDCGELDVLRDRDTGLIWVVDANPTPWGPPRLLTPVDMAAATERLAGAFHRLVDDRLGSPVGARN